MTTYFVSDLHLESARPETVQAFLGFLAAHAAGADRLFILGDLFEAWVGDDDTREPGPTVAAALRRLRSTGTWIGLLHGNRDFLLGDDFCAHAGAELLPDPHTVDLGGDTVLLSHGDRYCTDDADYQRFRRLVRDPEWQRQFLGQDIETRRAFAAQARDASRASQRGKAPEILDANQVAIETEMRNAGVRLLIHGHTHRPAVHEFAIDGERCTRYVLGQWESDAMVLRWDDGDYELFDAIGTPL
jgi:UDP-2,3-diacylglucosamine hydrolase